MLIPLRLHRNVEPFAVPANRTLQIPLPATGVEKDVVEMPAASIPVSVSLNLASRAVATELISISVHNPRVRGGGLHIWSALWACRRWSLTLCPVYCLRRLRHFLNGCVGSILLKNSFSGAARKKLQAHKCVAPSRTWGNHAISCCAQPGPF